MQNTASPDFVEFLCGQTILDFRLLQIAGINRLTNLLDLCPHGGLEGSITETMNFVLTESFLGAGCIRHNSIINDRWRRYPRPLVTSGESVIFADWLEFV